MALDWDELHLRQLEGDVKVAVVFRLETDPMVRLTTIVGDLTLATDTIETDAENVYRGLGEMLVPPVVNELINGKSQHAEFTLAGAGVSAEVLALASSEAASVRGAVAYLGIVFLDSHWQILSPSTTWLWEGAADSLIVARSPGQDDQEPVYSITVGVGTVFTGRSRPTPTFWTDPDQRRRSADDRFFDRVKDVSAGMTRIWPD